MLAAAFLAMNILFLMPSLEYLGITNGIENYSFLKNIPQHKVGNKVKAIRSNINISPYGGAVPILKKIKEYGIPQVIRSTLGVRKKQSRYGYDDVFIAWVLTALCGGTRLDHITKLKKKLPKMPGLKMPSHDTLGRVMKKLATKEKVGSVISKAEKGIVTQTRYNENIQLNRMLIKATKRIGALKEGKSYTLDIDATFLSSLCRGGESPLDRQGKHGFAPMVCLIGELPVYISLRAGDAGARFMLTESLETCLNLLEESKVKVGRVVCDAAGYSRAVTEMLEARGIKFVMRFPVAGGMQSFKESLKSGNWRQTEIKTAENNWNCEIADIPYQMYYPAYITQPTIQMRVVAIRFPTNKKLIETKSLEDRVAINRNRNKMCELKEQKKLKQPGKKYTEIHWKEIEDYTYKFFVTNDFKKTSEEIVYEYNKRGDSERKFSYMKSEFGWRLPPFQWMNENNVFLIVASLANNIFVGIRNMFKKYIPQINLRSRLKEFQFVFIDVACAYLDRQYIFYNTDIEYELLI